MIGIEILEPVLDRYGEATYDREERSLYYPCSLCRESGAWVLVNPQTKRVQAFCNLHRPGLPDLMTMTEFVLLALIREGRGVRRYDHPDGYTHIAWSGPSGHFSVDDDLAWAKTLRGYREGGGTPV